MDDFEINIFSYSFVSEHLRKKLHFLAAVSVKKESFFLRATYYYICLGSDDDDYKETSYDYTKENKLCCAL